ncbi:sulfite exporter TauE/SafE family protein [Polaromonas sp. UBA4122]|uniref:sulfite exporter TauE/SafE family protein n=1 Tax=Polaromonas sp. UBA4122 TaxID=1947074 RepID=UPI00260138B1|nr:sulfite exporter TauE/SafE family protein [Polaromonas sp. UBA4122]
MLSALVGAAGAFISKPFMTWCNVRIHHAIATSSALGFLLVLAGTLGYIWAGQDLPPMPAGSIGYLYLPGQIVHRAGQHDLSPWGHARPTAWTSNP